MPERNQLVMRKSDKRRRWFGLLYLLVAIIMLVWGLTWLGPYLVGWKFLLYWFGCFLVTMMAILVALLDMWIIRIRARQQRNKAAHQVFDEAAESEQDRTDREP